jgi:hypothetical protein
VAIVVGGAANSYAPMSHAAPSGRFVPRWSVEGGGHPPPASIAGLVAARAWVWVPPPLPASAPRTGLTFLLSLA